MANLSDFVYTQVELANVNVAIDRSQYAADTANAANTLLVNTGVGANAYANATFVKLAQPVQTITGDLAITGNLIVSGNTTTYSTNDLIINDPVVLLANTNTTDSIDIGFVAHYANATSEQVHTGFYREHTSKEWYLFKEYNVHFLDTNGHIDPSGNNFAIDMLNASIRTSNLILGGANAIVTIGAAFDVANTSGIDTQYAFLRANLAHAHANAAFFKANTAVTDFSPAFLTANIAYAHANAAFLKANTGGGGASLNVASDTVNATRYIMFANGTSGSVPTLNVASGLTFNPSTGTVSIPGALSAASLAGTAATGSGASGTWGISISGTAATASAVAWSGITSKPTTVSGYGITDALVRGGAIGNIDYNAQRTLASGIYSVGGSPTNGPPTGAYSNFIQMYERSDTAAQIVVDYANGYLYSRGIQTATPTYSAWRTYLNDGNYSSYALPLSGGTMSGTITSSATSIAIGNNGGATRGYLYNDTSGFGLLNSGGGWAVRVNYGTTTVYVPGTLTSDTDVRAPIFYDSNDTNYYLNPNSSSRLYSMTTINRIYSNEWIQMDNYSGLYSPLNGAHFYPNDASYGSWRIAGSRNGWGGIEFTFASTSLMMNTDVYGFHYNGVGWRLHSSGGSLYIPGDIVAYWSDRRLKENLRPIGSEASEILSKLTAYRFNWNDKVEKFKIGVKPGKEEIGLIAQEVQAILPDAVTVNKTSAKLDSKGDQIDGDYLTINWNKITPLLVQALNDTTRELNELKKLLKDKGIL